MTMKGHDAPVFTRVLIPLDGSTLAEQALPYARSLAGDRAVFYPLGVVAPPDPDRDMAGRMVATVDEVLFRIEGDLREALLRVGRLWLGEEAEIKPVVAVGDPAAEILRAAAEVGADLIVLASHGRGAMGRAIFGSVADRIARSAPVPVMIIRPLDAPIEIVPLEVRRIVAPLDGSELAAEALPVAAGLAWRLGAPVLLVRAVDSTPGVPPFPETFALQEEELERLEGHAREELEAIEQRLNEQGISTQSVARAGWPYDVITSEIVDGDLIVMTSHGRGGVRRWLIGSVAEKLVRGGPVPVLLVPVGARAAAEASEEREAEALALVR
jgi:nucleotide-binding universal stress UspA family protein